jgi:hypothetical protein
MLDLRRLVLLSALVAGCDDGSAGGDAAVGPDGAPGFDGGSAVADAAVDASIDAGADAGPIQLTTGFDFATGQGSLCGLGVDPDNGDLWVQPCMGTSIIGFLADGEPIDGVGARGEAADDVDVTFAPVAFTLNRQTVAAGEMLFVNGETGATEIYPHQHQAAEPLVAEFGASHVVGGAFHPGRGTFFLVQDKQAAVDPTTVAEIDVVSGEVMGKFSTLPGFDVNYGDLEVCRSTGHLLLVSSVEMAIAEFSPEGVLLAKHPLPAGVTGASGLGLAGEGVGWISSTTGQAWRVEGLPCE